MADERSAAWPAADDCSVLGKETQRRDGAEKASGHAKYTADTNPKGTLYARLLTCTMGHAKIALLDVEPARKFLKDKGAHAIYIFPREGGDKKECLFDGAPVVAIAAERDEIARDALREVKVKFEPLDHFVQDEDIEAAQKAGRAKEPAEKVDGEPDAAFKTAAHVHEGYYGIPVITHCCLESHGTHQEWKDDDSIVGHVSTQAVSTIAQQYVAPLGVDQAKVRVICDYVGGGFGSKFQLDEWGIAAAKMSKDSGRPVRLMLDRATELKIAGNRPSGFAKVKIAADKEGKVVAWDSHHWGTNGPGGATVDLNQYPYVFTFPNQRRKATGIMCNIGPSRAWRAPNHPQLCALTCTVLDDLAAAMGMDSYDLFRKNLEYTENHRSEPDEAKRYAEQMERAARLIGWKDKWHAHGKGPKKDGVVRGLGLALHRWAGRAGQGNCTLRIHHDGTVESTMGTQDIGTGTRTVIAVVLAETFGLSPDDIKVNVGSNAYPFSGPSGGSTTVGGVSAPNRRAAVEALTEICDRVAKKYNVAADTLTARDGKIWSGKDSVCTWKQACSLLGMAGLEVQGKGPKKDGLTDDGVGGVQMAEVSVDTETGQVRVHKFVAVQDCGLVVNRNTARSQIYGALIMGIAYSLTEQQIMDPTTGRFINADLENYKLPRIGDIGELVVDFYEPESERSRGVIGLGEPPVIAPGACLSNAVANALGVRVPVLPMTPKRVLDALKGAKA